MHVNVTQFLRLPLEEFGDGYTRRSDQELALLEAINVMELSLEKKFKSSKPKREVLGLQASTL